MKANFIILIFTLFYFFTGSIFSQVVINDEHFEKQWYLNMPGTENTRADIRVLDAWTRTMGSSSQKIADIGDNNGGVPSVFHPDLLNRINTNGNIIIGEHSTNIAGLLVANHNTIGIAGVNKFATLLSYENLNYLAGEFYEE